MLPEANRITLSDVTTHQITLVMKQHRHFLIQYELYAAAQVQTIIKTDRASLSRANVAGTYAVIF